MSDTATLLHLIASCNNWQNEEIRETWVWLSANNYPRAKATYRQHVAIESYKNKLSHPPPYSIPLEAKEK